MYPTRTGQISETLCRLLPCLLLRLRFLRFLLRQLQRLPCCGACCDACCCCQPAQACLALVAPQRQPHQQQRVRAPHSWQRPLGHVATEEVERVVPSRRGLAASLRSAPRSDELWRRRTSPRLLRVRHWHLHEPQARELPLVLRHVVEARELICGQRHQQCRHHEQRVESCQNGASLRVAIDLNAAVRVSTTLS